MAAVNDRTMPGTCRLLNGNHCAAYGAKLSRVEVVSAYPITPQSPVVEKLSEMVTAGELAARFIKVESEHSALSALLSASAAGVRTFTASARQGLLLMHEVIHAAGRGRAPIVMAVANSSIAFPMDIGTEHDDSFSQRDTAWLQFYCQDNQEILDTVIQSYWIAERVSLPVMVCYDGITMSHTSETVFVPDAEAVDQYLPKRQTRYRLNPNEPMGVFAGHGGSRGSAYLSRLRRRTQEATEIAREVARQADEEFNRHFGRGYGLFESYKTEDADVILVALSTIASMAHDIVDELRKQGKKVGLLRIRMLRPFPTQELAAVLKNARKVAVIDRDISYGRGGVLALEVKAALYSENKRPPVFGFITGLCGLTVTPGALHEIVDYVYANERPQQEIIWIGIPAQED